MSDLVGNPEDRFSRVVALIVIYSSKICMFLSATEDFNPDFIGTLSLDMSLPMGKPTICIGENKGADQLRGHREADQRLCFRYTDSTVPLLSKYEISCF